MEIDKDGNLRLPVVFPNALGVTKEEFDNVTQRKKNAGAGDVRKSASHQRKGRQAPVQSKNAPDKQGSASNNSGQRRLAS